MSWFADKPPGLLFNATISSYCDGEIFIVGFYRNRLGNVESLHGRTPVVQTLEAIRHILDHPWHPYCVLIKGLFLHGRSGCNNITKSSSFGSPEGLREVPFRRTLLHY